MYISLLTNIKNASAAKKPSLKFRFSKMDYSVAQILASHGFLKKVDMKGRGAKKVIDMELYDDAVHGMRMVSTPSLRRFSGYRDFKKVKGGNGILIVSTPQGIMTGDRARREKHGGQLLFEIW